MWGIKIRVALIQTLTINHGGNIRTFLGAIKGLILEPHQIPLGLIIHLVSLNKINNSLLNKHLSLVLLKIC